MPFLPPRSNPSIAGVAATLWMLCLLAAAPAQATTLFSIDPSLSQLTISNATFQSTANPTFVTDLVPVPPTTFTRQVDGSVFADGTTGMLESANLIVLPGPLLANQTRDNAMGMPVDIGDVVLGSLTLAIDDMNNAMITGGLISYDVSTGSSRIMSMAPRDLSGDMSMFANMGGSPVLGTLGGLQSITIPVLVDFVDLAAVPGGATSFTVSGTIVAVVPEPATGTLLALGVGTLGWVGRHRRRRDRIVRRVPRARALRSGCLGLSVLVLFLTGCPDAEEAEEESDPLPPVETMDDSAATTIDQRVLIPVLANDMEDDGLVCTFTQAVDQATSAMQPGSVMSGFGFGGGFPEELAYTPPAGFEGTATFTYDIFGFGSDFDSESMDTGTVTVTVMQGFPFVDAVNDLAQTTDGFPVVIDVLMNDSEDANTILSFTGATDLNNNPQPGAVSLVPGAVEMLLYRPPAGFTDIARFDYTIEGAGTSFFQGSQDTATAFIDVRPAPTTFARVQFQENTSGPPFPEFIEFVDFFVTQANINNDIVSAQVFGFGEISACVDVAGGLNVPLRAQIAENTLITVDGICPFFQVGMDYTVVVQDAATGGLEIICVQGLADPDPALCP